MGRVVGLCEVKRSMRLSEGSYNEESSLKVCIWFQMGFVEAGGLGVRGQT